MHALRAGQHVARRVGMVAARHCHRENVLTRHIVPMVMVPCQSLISKRRAVTTAATDKTTLPQELFEGTVFGDFPKRTHRCGELNKASVGQKVVLCGWSQNVRKFSDNLIFMPIRDASGSTQLVLKDEDGKLAQIRAKLLDLSPESVICVEGVVVARSTKTINSKMATGEIEVDITKLHVLNKTHATLPFLPGNQEKTNEELRLKYRVLDLRRQDLQDNLRRRSYAAWVVRDYLIGQGFVEVETPMLFKSTPEGAREFVVPTREKGDFYALPQSPQQYKQLLMASGVDRYFQLAKCFRDEDLRADRQPEFTQIDMEMSFGSAKDVQNVVEGLVTTVWKKVLDISFADPFPHMDYQTAMSKYGSDKPDTRFGLEIKQIGALKGDETLEAIVLPNELGLSGSEMKKLAKNEASMTTIVKLNEDNIAVWLDKMGYNAALESPADQIIVNTLLDVRVGDALVISKRPSFLSGGQTNMGRVRLALADFLKSKGAIKIPKDQFNFLWVEGFPLFSPDEPGESDISKAGTRKFSATHHPFTAPVAEDLDFLATAPEKVRGQHYDLVLNGVEIGGGSIRVHSPKLQMYIFQEVLKMTPLECSRFSHLIDGLSFGCPPHGGLAIGFDRMMAILCGTSSIRDVIAFPKSTSGRDLVVDSPSPLTPEQLRQYNLSIV
ncbi:hypothetical protein DFQ27_006553 [Actinomortierella ambigua]|uniref:Aminoacyl-transfer RNA synthetases class-II family profile domain-containing protein n=1 Tax=Actinomortierella ambigua TaxID=1343610 RepID=A0A9P6QHY6_9FUNG|nr:hypothetical protein DFQ27_006553 [Actinomortierella ambigua]